MESFRVNRGLIGVCAAMVMCSGAAFGQQGGDFTQPLDKAAAGKSTKRPGAKARTRTDDGQGMAAGESRMVIQSSGDGEDTYQITINNGEVEAKVNGKAVPAERVRRSKDKVEILDESGKVLKSFDVSLGSAGGGAAKSRLFRPAQPAQPLDQFPPMEAQVWDVAQPKVMIGITMGEPSEALARHLGIKQDEAVVVEKVIDGLPADKAGLKVEDVIVEVDGVGKLNQQTFREAINKHEPGEKVTLKILRKGEEQKLTVELKKFDSEKLGMKGVVVGGNGAAPEGWRQFDNGAFNWNNDQFKDLFKDNPEARKQFEEAMKHAWRVNPDGQAGQAWVFGNGPEGQFKFTPFGGADSKRLDEMQSQLDKKIAELDDKLARINDQMAKLEKLLNKMSEKGTR